jgi:hypothetical protein
MDSNCSPRITAAQQALNFWLPPEGVARGKAFSTLAQLKRIMPKDYDRLTTRRTKTGDDQVFIEYKADGVPFAYRCPDCEKVIVGPPIIVNGPHSHDYYTFCFNCCEMISYKQG